uniref:Uncharacterized protein n=1 Tax=Anguilla anguilla TaxID=7936 RepID=A0A0E9S3S4_ANGAN
MNYEKLRYETQEAIAPALAIIARLSPAPFLCALKFIVPVVVSNRQSSSSF